MDQNGLPENKIRKVLFNEVSLITGVVSIILVGVFWVANPQHKVELEVQHLNDQLQSITEKVTNLKDNDLHTLETKINGIEAQIREIRDIVIRLETKLETVK